ncbi:MAG: endonuclease/exonuclease/phosphatase family protein [Promethearchaeota archaeon]
MKLRTFLFSDYRRKKLVKCLRIILVLLIFLNGFLIIAQFFDLNKIILSNTEFNNINAEISSDTNISLRIMTYNIRLGAAIEKNEADNWNNRRDDLANYISQFNLDILGVQEAYYFQLDYILDFLNNAPENDDNNNQNNTKPFLSKRKYAFTGFGRRDAVHGGEHSAIIYDSNKYNFLYGDTFWLSEFPQIPSKSWGSSHYRICTWAIFEEITTGFKFAVFNTHFDFNYNFHVNAMKLIKSKIQDYLGESPKIPVILMGDMNFISDSPGYNEITDVNQSIYLKDAYREFYNGSEPKDYTVSKFDANYIPESDKRIDFFFINNYIDIKNITIPKDSYGANQTYSDHYPVFLEAILKNT